MTKQTATKPAEGIIAYHEAGHALICLILKNKLNSVTIIPEKETLGECASTPKGKPLFRRYKNDVYKKNYSQFLANDFISSLSSLVNSFS